MTMFFKKANQLLSHNTATIMSTDMAVTQTLQMHRFPDISTCLLRANLV